jgi:histidine ammonia-lyase
MQMREGLALINGTSSMSGIGALNVYYAKLLIQTSILASGLLFEIVEASEDYFSKEISEVRPHVGQKSVGELFRSILKDSKLVRDTDMRAAHSVVTDTIAMQQSRQEIYSIRCAVQILGPIFDELTNATRVVETEMNSVTDNPIIFTDSKIVHGGNFHGDYVSYEMDKLKIAITKLSIFSERKLNFLVNDKVNKMFPPFLNKGTVGLDLGLQGLQFVATSTVAENQSLSMPVSVHSISCNNDNQDIVSMGTNSALIAEKVIMNTFDVLAIELTALARGVDALDIKLKLSTKTRHLYNAIKGCASHKGDLVKRGDIQRVVDMLKRGEIGDLQ